VNEDGDVVTLGVEDGVGDCKGLETLDFQTGFLQRFTLGTLEIGFAKLLMAAREAILPYNSR